MPADSALSLPVLSVDYRHGGPIALKYVKRGYHVLCSHGLTLLLMPLAAMGLVRAGWWWQVLDPAR